jgi:hypothetical protein
MMTTRCADFIKTRDGDVEWKELRRQDEDLIAGDADLLRDLVEICLHARAEAGGPLEVVALAWPRVAG